MQEFTITAKLPEPPDGFRWALGGWMGPTPERPWPALLPDPNVTITLPQSEWSRVIGGLQYAGRADSVMRRECTLLADVIQQQGESLWADRRGHGFPMLTRDDGAQNAPQDSRPLRPVD